MAAFLERLRSFFRAPPPPPSLDEYDDAGSVRGALPAKVLEPALVRLESPLVEKAGPAGASSNEPGAAIASSVIRTQSPLPRGADELLALYRESPWLRAVAHRIAFSTSSVRWRLYARRGAQESGRKFILDKSFRRMARVDRELSIEQGLSDGSLTEIEAHPFLDLFDRPNPRMTGRAARQVAQLHIDLIGETYLVLDTNAFGMPTAFWPIPPTWVTELPTAVKPVFTISFAGEKFEVPVTHVIPIRDPNPGDPLQRGAGVGEALRDELGTDESASKHVGAWFHNRAMPDMLIALKGAKQAVVEQAKRVWESKLRGFAKAYQTHWTGAEIDVKRLDTSFKDMALVDIRKAARDTIIQTWGVPPEVMGILENSNRATITAAQMLFAEHVVIPRLEMWRGELQSTLVTMFDERLILSYDSPIPADEEAQRATLVALPRYATIDEVRARQGLSPLPDERGRGFLVEAGISYVADLAQLKTGTLQPHHLQAGIPTINEAREQLGLPRRADGDKPTSAFGSAVPPPAFGTPPPAKPADEDKPAPAANGDQGFDEGEGVEGEDVPGAAALSWRARRETRRWRRKDLTEGNLEQVLNAIDVESMRRSMEPVIADLVREWGQQTIHALDDSLTFDLTDPEVAGHIRDFAAERIGRLINTTTRNELRAELEAALAEGETRSQIVGRVREVFRRADLERSDIIAKTESLRSSQFATNAAFEQSGIELRREWISTHDGRAREAHLAMDGQTRGLTEPFEVPTGQYTGARAMQPGGFGIGALDVNCRCVLGALVDDDDADDGKALVGAGLRRTKATERERREVWKAADEKLQPWDERIARAAVRGFNDQERRVLDVVDSLFS